MVGLAVWLAAKLAVGYMGGTIGVTNRARVLRAVLVLLVV
jgi:hypothetical protein